MLRIESLVAELERLERGPALTVYLRTDAFGGVAADPARELAAVLERLRRSLRGVGSHAPAFELEAESMAARIGNVALGTRGVAVFSCSRRMRFNSVPLEAPLPAGAYWGDRFELAPLEAALARADRALVLLLDSTRARLFRVMWHEIEEARPLRAADGEVDGLSGEAALRAHVGRAAETLRHLTRGLKVDVIVVGGAADAVAMLQEMLPGDVRERLDRCDDLPVDAPAARVLEASLEAIWRAQRQRDGRLVDELLSAASAGRAAVGPGAVVEALASGDVRRLVVPEGLHLRGGECSGCGLLAPALTPVCAACGAPLRPVPDLVQRMEERVTGAGGEVDEVGGQAAAVLAEHDGLGAFLR